jgi:predicted NUDIX family NTP pyrophosphohydrolase
MAAARSAGIVVYRRYGDRRPEVLLVHPGGPIWARRDLGVWSIPKGEYAVDEDSLTAARREYEEELGSAPPDGEPLELGEIRQKSGKLVRAWALAGDLDTETVHSNTFELEWPPKSGIVRTYPEIDRAEWFALPDAVRRLIPAQVPLLERLERALA